MEDIKKETENILYIIYIYNYYYNNFGVDNGTVALPTSISPFSSRPGSMVIQMLVWLSP